MELPPGALGKAATKTRNHSRRNLGLITFLFALLAGDWAGAQSPVPSGQQVLDRQAASSLRVAGRHFRDGQGRAVILRGVNLGGDSKVPPFRASVDPVDLDRLAACGFNVIRLLVIWEAYEPLPGTYREDYLAALRTVADEAYKRGIHTVIDFHQDGFSRFASRGCGDGFPSWAVSARGKSSCPDNSESCRPWPFLMAFDPTTHKSFRDFYRDVGGLRSRYLAMVERAAAAFAGQPGVIGYDLINEPWGREKRELGPLYEDAATVIRRRHPGAVLFLEGHVTTITGLPTRLPRPDFGNAVYAPHYYHPISVMSGRWHGFELPIQLAFGNMTKTARAWDVPLFLGEFGIGADVERGADYVTALYDQMDKNLASGAQWNYSPGWNAVSFDGWNGEDYSLMTPEGQLRANFQPRPYPRATAGTPVGFDYQKARGPGDQATVQFAYLAVPEAGLTEIFLPSTIFLPGSQVELKQGRARLGHDPARQIMTLGVDQPGPVLVIIRAPRSAS